MPSILLVDDELTIIDSLTYSLRREGFEVITALDGSQALDLFGTVHPDLVILDIRLPGMDELEVLRRIDLDQRAGKPGALQIGELRADPTSRRVFKADKEVQLSTREFDLLMTLMSQSGRAVSRDELISKIWGSDWSGDPRTLEVHIRWLRLKIEDDPTIPRYVQTVRGYGYRFIGSEELE
jgi:DNA-binding response OmpR family regulator